MTDRLAAAVRAVWTNYIGLPASGSEDETARFLHGEAQRLGSIRDDLAGKIWAVRAKEWQLKHGYAIDGYEAVSLALSALEKAEDQAIKDVLIQQIPHRVVHDRRHRWTNFEAEVTEPIDILKLNTGRSSTAAWRRRADDEHFDVEYRGAAGSDGRSGPIEDYALPPEVPWTDADKKAAQDKYIALHGLARGEWVDMEWPPEPSLWREGGCYLTDGEPCAAHLEDGEPDDCADCQDSVTEEVDVMAEWHWTTTVRTYEIGFSADGAEQQDEYVDHGYLVATVEQDPRDVLLGPPDRGYF